MNLPMPPRYLEVAEYSRVKESMLTEQPFSPWVVSGARDAFVGGYLGSSENAPFEASFSAQIRQVCMDYQTLGADFDRAPEIYFVTARSAIPVADAVRGYYEELGSEAPHIKSVMAQRWLAEDWRNSMAENSTHARTDAEVDRLTQFVDGTAHACVIDQYVSSGNTLNYAAEVVRMAGAQRISVIRGRWYHQLGRRQASFEKATSIHSRCMREIGRQSCQTQISI